MGFDEICGCATGGDWLWNDVRWWFFWEIGGGYGGFAAEKVGGVWVRELLRREKESLKFCFGLFGLT